MPARPDAPENRIPGPSQETDQPDSSSDPFVRRMVRHRSQYVATVLYGSAGCCDRNDAEGVRVPRNTDCSVSRIPDIHHLAGTEGFLCGEHKR